MHWQLVASAPCEWQLDWPPRIKKPHRARKYMHGGAVTVRFFVACGPLFQVVFGGLPGFVQLLEKVPSPRPGNPVERLLFGRMAVSILGSPMIAIVLCVLKLPQQRGRRPGNPHFCGVPKFCRSTLRELVAPQKQSAGRVKGVYPESLALFLVPGL